MLRIPLISMLPQTEMLNKCSALFVDFENINNKAMC